MLTLFSFTSSIFCIKGTSVDLTDSSHLPYLTTKTNLKIIYTEKEVPKETFSTNVVEGEKAQVPPIILEVKPCLLIKRPNVEARFAAKGTTSAPSYTLNSL